MIVVYYTTLTNRLTKRVFTTLDEAKPFIDKVLSKGYVVTEVDSWMAPVHEIFTLHFDDAGNWHLKKYR